MNLMRLTDRINRVGQVVILVVALGLGLAGAFTMDSFWSGVLFFLIFAAMGLLFVAAGEGNKRLRHRMYGKLVESMDAHPEEMAKMEKNPVLGRLFRLVRKQD